MKKNNNASRFVDLDKEIKFEKRAWIANTLWECGFFLIALWVWVKKLFVKDLETNFYLYDGSSHFCKELKENAGRWRALDIVYNYKIGQENAFADFWSQIMSAQAVRNRLELVKYLLPKIIDQTHQDGKEVNIISIACGSAQGVLKAVADAKDRGISAKLLLIDLDQSALDHALKNAKILGIAGQVACVRSKASSIVELSKNFKPTIIEMVGFLEYRSFDKSVRLIKSIYDSLAEGGIFLTSQIAPNLESFFMLEVLNWLMIYRNPAELENILKEAGFLPGDCKFYWEPFRVHFVIECKKP